MPFSPFFGVILFHLAFSQIFIGTESVIKVTASISAVKLQICTIVTPPLLDAKEEKAVIAVHLD